MKKLFTILFWMVSLSVLADATLTVRVPWSESHYQYGAGPLLWLTFDNTLNDSSGNSFNGTGVGFPTFTTGVDGTVNHAINFNGTSQYATFTTLGSFGAYMSGGFTIQTWVKTSFTNTYEVIAGSQAASGVFCSLYLNYSAGKGGVFPGNIECVVSDGTRTCTIDYTNNSGICDGNWHLLTASINPRGNSGTFVMDGTVLATARSSSSQAVTNSVNLPNVWAVGNRATLLDGYFHGAVDDFRIYPRQISLYEIQGLYHALSTNVVFTGVPNYTNIFATLTGIDNTGHTDVSGAVQTAVNASSQASAVILPNGLFYFASTVSMPDGIVLRGTGSNTVVTGNGSNPTELFLFNGHRDYDGVSNILSGYTQGSTNITFSTLPSDINTRMFIQIQQQNDLTLVQPCGIDGCVGDYCFGQWLHVTGISNNTVQFWPPLYYTYSATYNPRVRYPVSLSNPNDNFSANAGIENLVISNQNVAANANVYLTYAANCWLKNIVSLNGAVCHIWPINTEFCEFRDSVFNGILGPITSSRGYGLQMGTPNGGAPCEKCTADLIENNIWTGCRGTVIMGYGASGNVVAYNYFVNTFSEAPAIEKMDVSIHSAHPYANLIEDNQGTKINADDFHGSSSHGTVFRNQWLGINPVGVSFSSIASMEIDMTNHFYNLVDNVSGYPGIVAYMASLTSPTGGSISLALAPDNSWNFSHWWKANMFGYQGEGGGTSPFDPVSYSSAVFTGNFDYKTNGIIWDVNGPTTFSNSYYLTAQPVWYTFNVGNGSVSNIVFPAIGADLTPMVSDIPAKVRYQLGGFPYSYPATNIAPPPGPQPSFLTGRLHIQGKFLLK